ncbi:amino acid adenylation domain-containing protein [Calothrix sp. NIES-4071]|nr:amino acid adenylation domain-containing protein [Calothrix sp. NIES-4071]BAZ60460.1 amino acid adenylation domain-containing protein [Calothrix sp. NIES-4105]
MKTIQEFLSNLANSDIKLWLDVNETTSEEVRLRCNAPKGTLTPDIRTHLAERKAEIISFLQQGIESNSTVEAITPIGRDINLPLSFGQARLWFLYQLEGQTATYNIPVTLRLFGELNTAAFEMAVQEIVRRHEVLRTNFKMVNDSAVQVIAGQPTVTISIVDLQQVPYLEQSNKVQQLALSEVQKPFDLSNDSLLRVTLLRLSEKSHVLLLTMHHIISDGWSMGVFINELSELYQAFCNGQPSQLPELLIQYADFAYWQRHWLSGEVLQTQLNYWKQNLTGIPPLLELPTDRPRPSVQTFQGSFTEFLLNQELTSQIKALSQKSGTTLFMTLLAAFATLLSRYSGQEDIVIGSPIANRNRSQVESLIGFFVNTQVLRTKLHGNPNFSELLERVRETTLGAYDHQDLPFEKLVEELQPERSLSHTPLFQVMFVMENTPIGKLELPGLTITPLELENITAKFDLTLSIEETASGLLCGWEYNSDLFGVTTIEQMAVHFQTLLESIVKNPLQRVAQLPLLSATEQHQLLVEWNNTGADYPLEQTFTQQFEAIVEKNPLSIAVVFENQQLTYQQLNARANRWARHLVSLGVGAETIVALNSERNIDFLTAMLAVFKAGAAYLPLNPDHPTERNRQVLEQSQVSLVLSASSWSSLVNHLETEPQLLLLEDLDSFDYSSQNLPVRSTPENLAYVIYTSGSTGKPKGAMLEHRGMLNHLYAKVTDLQLTQTDIVAQTAAQTFDISIWQFLVALLVGGQVEIVRTSITTDPAELLTLMQSKQISILEIVPSLLRMMLEHIELSSNNKPNLSELRWLLLTGETLPPQLCRQWLEYYPAIPMMNAYGPTECSDDVTHYPIYTPPAEEILNLPIGHPVANTQLYILDKYLQPVPIGVPGELYVGGVSVGRGYLHNSQQTQLAFVKNPFRDITQNSALRTQHLLYKTGDKARYLFDGNIEFLNRIDYQVKIRGFRIELGEIEAVLTQHPQVREVVVIAREDQPGNQYLVAYIVPNSVLSNKELRDFLKQKLPEYMIPTAFVMLESIPLTPNGKVDRRALPVPELSSSDNFVAPSDMLELELTQIWEEILHVHPIGVRDNFFDLGGHSLLAVSLIARIQQKFNKKLSLAALFQGATVEHLANIIRSSTDFSSSSTLVTLQQGDSKRRPLFCVHPGGGTVLAYLNLARHLDPAQPVYGLESLDLDDEQKLHNKVEDMAAFYIEVMQSVQPQGPYLIGGWSFGGLVAFEIAQQMQAQGQQVSLLALLDTYPFTEYEELNEADDVDFITELLARNNGAILGIPPELDAVQAQRLLQVFKGHILAANDYNPQPYPGKVALFLAEGGIAADSVSPIIGWEKLATKGVDIHWVPGDHHTMVSKPNVEILAQKLQICLEQLQANDGGKND